MTTKEVERDKVKCAKYWPDEGETKEWGPAKVTCQMENITSAYTLRKLLLSWRDEGERHIYQYHFQVWPDHGVPNDPACVLNFLHDISTRQEQMRTEGVSPVSVITRLTIYTMHETHCNRLYCNYESIGARLCTLFGGYWTNRHIHCHTHDFGCNKSPWTRCGN